MPSRNVLKIDIENSYYHVYARGASRKEIFIEDDDFKYFVRLISRYLSNEPQHDSSGRVYAHLRDDVVLLAYCLMPNHFHLLFYQTTQGALSTLMRGVMTSYSRYFNHKYDRSGPLFETRYKSSRISNDAYLMHISRYIHLNHAQWRTWEWSSYPLYEKRMDQEWLRKDKVLSLFSSLDEYLAFVADYEDNQRMLEQIKHELAGT